MTYFDKSARNVLTSAGSSAIIKQAVADAAAHTEEK